VGEQHLRISEGVEEGDFECTLTRGNIRRRVSEMVQSDLRHREISTALLVLHERNQEQVVKVPVAEKHAKF
jgi:hypothetical protein